MKHLLERKNLLLALVLVDIGTCSGACRFFNKCILIMLIAVDIGCEGAAVAVGVGDLLSPLGLQDCPMSVSGF